VRGADTSARHLTPESAGLYAVASGFRETSKDDHENMARQREWGPTLSVFTEKSTAVYGGRRSL